MTNEPQEQWVFTDIDQWVDNDLDQWVDYVFDVSRYNLVAKEISYFLTGKNKAHYFVAEDDRSYYFEAVDRRDLVLLANDNILNTEGD